MRFNPAPGWPRPPTEWVPHPGWQPDPSWPPAPPGWKFWVEDDAEPQPKSSHGYGISITYPTSYGVSLISRHGGMLAAGIGGSITLVSFLVLPHFSVPLLGGLKMPTIISFLSRFESNFLFLWLVPAAALLIAGTGLWLRSSTTVSPPARLRLTRYVGNLSLLVSISYIALIAIPLSEDDFGGDSAAVIISLLGMGYYLGFLGMIAALIGSTVESRELNSQGRSRS